MSIQDMINWTNENSGFVSVLIFIVTFLIALFSGLFSYILKKIIGLFSNKKLTITAKIDYLKLSSGNSQKKLIQIEITNIGKEPIILKNLCVTKNNSEFELNENIKNRKLNAAEIFSFNLIDHENFDENIESFYVKDSLCKSWKMSKKDLKKLKDDYKNSKDIIHSLSRKDWI